MFVLYWIIIRVNHSSAQVWVYAAAQVFNSIGIAFGSMIAFASYNPFHGRIFR